MIVEITKCSDKDYWYNDKIGDQFRVFHRSIKPSNDGVEKYQLDPSGPLTYDFIDKADCKIINP